MTVLRHISIFLLGTLSLGVMCFLEARAGAGDPDQLYDRVKQKFVEQKYEEALALVADIKAESNPPLLQQTESMILERLWQKAWQHYNVGRYDLAFAAVVEAERYAKPLK